MIVKKIYGPNRTEKPERTRYSTRAIIIDNGKLLLSKFERDGIYMLPGGGVEGDESLEECCIREVLEETGYICKPIKTNVIIEEFHYEMHYVGQYFICELVGKGEQNLTPREIECGLKVEWIDFDKAYEMFANYADHSDYWEKESTYFRDYNAIKLSLEIE